MFNNLFKSFTYRLFPYSYVDKNPHKVVGEGEKRLRDVTKQLTSLREEYDHGKFSGNPEETLETISDFETLKRTLIKAKRRGWTPNAKVINAIHHDIQNQTEYMKMHSYSPAEINSEIEWRQVELEEALIGLR